MSAAKASAVEAEADAIAERLRVRKKQPCAAAKHPQAALITALLARKVGHLDIEREIKPFISDSSVRAHARGECTCART